MEVQCVFPWLTVYAQPSEDNEVQKRAFFSYFGKEHSNWSFGADAALIITISV